MGSEATPADNNKRKLGSSNETQAILYSPCPFERGHKENVKDFIIKHHYSKSHSAEALTANLARFAIAFIKKNKATKNKFQQLKNIAYKILRPLCSNQAGLNIGSQTAPFHGAGFRFAGRVYGAKKAASFKMLFGSVPFSTLDANIDYANIMQKTRNGT